MLQFEVAGTVIQLEDTEAALVVYADSKFKGEQIEVDCEENKRLKATFIERITSDRAVCAAILPRIRMPFKTINSDTVVIYSKNFSVQSVTIARGNVTETYLKSYLSED